MSAPEKTIMLLDIDHFYGESEGRLGPTLKFLIIGLGPILVWVYTGFLLPVWLFWPLEVIWLVRVGLITLGREKERLAQYRRQLNDDYSSSEELLRIKTVHDDGCVEYVNGRVTYFMVATNGTSYDTIARSKMIREFLTQFSNQFDIDIYAQNITELKSLEDRYSNVKLFTDEEAAKDFIDIIDHNRSVVYSGSRLVRLVIAVKASRSYWTEVRDTCKQACYSAAAKAFKNIHLASREEVLEIINTDVRTYVDVDGILQKKYATHNYFGSRVLYFGDKPEDKGPDTSGEERGFLVDDE